MGFGKVFRLAGRIGAVAATIVLLASTAAVRAEEGSGREPAPAAEPKNIPVLPVAFYLQETSLALGALVATTHRWHGAGPATPPSNVFLYTFYTLKGQFNGALEAEGYLRDGRDKYYLRTAYEVWPNTFWGIGSRAGHRTEGEEYTREGFSLEARGLTRVGGSVRAGLGVDLSFLAITEREEGGLLDEGRLTGSRGGDSAGLGFLLEWDDRDERFWPSRGGYHRLGAWRFVDVFRSGSDFARYTLDLRHFIPLRPDHTLALQLLLDATTGDPPFERLAMLGGPLQMRGLYKGRFRDRDALAAQAEYRFPLRGRFRGVLFAGAGEVAHTPAELARGDVLVAGGAGLRYALQPKDKLNIRLDLAVSEFGFAPYVLVNEAF